MKARLVRIGWVATVLFTAFFVLAANAAKPKKAKSQEASPPPAVETQRAAWPAAELTLGFQVRDSETEGIGDLLIPIWNPGGNGLLFLNPRSAFTDHSAEEYNLGIGYRQLFPKYNFIVGANAYYDYRDTAAGHYDQWGVGLEFLSPWLDARANYYDPEDKQLVVARESETTSRQYTRTTSAWLDPYAEEHAVLQDFRVTQTLVTETFTRTFEQVQQPLGGYDWEVGLRLPIQAKNIEARIFGGYYDFDRDFGDDVKGWKARAEVRIRSTLFLDAGVYENDDLTGSDWFAGARISVPLDLAALSRGRNPFADTSARWNGQGREFSARLTEMVMRDPQIRLETSKMIENKQLSTQDVTKQNTVQQGAFVLLPDVQFVDGDAPFSGDGSAEFPLTTIQAGANTVFGSRNVYVYNASSPYNENVVLQDGTTLWGSGSLIQGMGGKTFGSGIAPIVDGMSMGPSITVANNTTVRGMHVRNTDMGGPLQPIIIPGLDTMEVYRAGIFGNDVTGVTIDQNILQGNDYGAVFGRVGDFSLRFSDNVVQNNDADGLWVQGVGSSGVFDVLVQNSDFQNNAGSGAQIWARNYDFAVTEVRDSLFTGNGETGLGIIQNSTFVAMALVDGVRASGNGYAGVDVYQELNFASLANLSGITANNNGEWGVSLFQDSDLFSIGLVGTPEGIGDLFGGLGGLLPPEFARFFGPSGGITANNNNWGGVAVEQYGLSGITLAGVFDVMASGNNGDGVNVWSINDNGLALAIAGSSRNYGEILELASDALGLFGLDVDLSIPGSGQMVVEGNAGNGITMVARGGAAGLGLLVGAEAVGNLGSGVDLSTEGGFLALSAAARILAQNNVDNGINLDAAGDTIGLGLIADVNASGNGTVGINARVFSDNGVAALLTLSTDALRPLASSLLDYQLPGDPWGPVVASGNTIHGISATVNGYNAALALFLDTHANNNGAAGFDVSVNSDNGIALAALLSSDLLYDFIPGLFGGDPIPGAGLGGIQANYNWDNGINLNVTGYGQAIALLAGVDASDNFVGGINAALTSSDSGAAAILVDVNASGNVSGNGINLDMQSYWDSLIGMVFVDADWNGGNGIGINANSDNGSTYALLSAVYPWYNAGIGIYANLTASEDVALAITDSSARYNGNRGASLFLTAGANAYLFAGDDAANDLDFVYGFSGMLGPLAGYIPVGPVYTVENGGGGFFAEVTSTGGDVVMDIDGVNSSGNSNRGFNLNLNAVNGDISAYAFNLMARDNGGTGLDIDLIGGGGNAALTLYQADAINNGNQGINIADNYTGGTYIIGEQLTVINNTQNGVRLLSDGAGALAADFGGGGDSAGLSTFFGNGNRDFRYNNGTPITVMAENNWWGANIDPVANGQTAGSIDADPWLPAAP